MPRIDDDGDFRGPLFDGADLLAVAEHLLELKPGRYLSRYNDGTEEENQAVGNSLIMMDIARSLRVIAGREVSRRTEEAIANAMRRAKGW